MTLYLLHIVQTYQLRFCVQKHHFRQLEFWNTLLSVHLEVFSAINSLTFVAVIKQHFWNRYLIFTTISVWQMYRAQLSWEEQVVLYKWGPRSERLFWTNCTIARAMNRSQKKMKLQLQAQLSLHWDNGLGRRVIRRPSHIFPAWVFFISCNNKLWLSEMLCSRTAICMICITKLRWHHLLYLHHGMILMVLDETAAL